MSEIQQDSKKEDSKKIESEPVNWKQIIANVTVTLGTIFAIAGGYLTIKTFDKNYELDTTVEKVKSEAIMGVQRHSADQYRLQIGEIRKKIIVLESSIEKIDLEKIHKDKKTGVLFSGENLKLSNEVQVGLENLNKEIFRLPSPLSSPVTQARAELYNRFQNKVFNVSLSGSQKELQANPFFIREFDSAIDQGLKEIIKKDKD